MTRNRKNTRASSLSELADELGVSLDTLIAWIDQTTLIGMIKVGYNPFTMSRALPPSVIGYLRKRWGVSE